MALLPIAAAVLYAFTALVTRSHLASESPIVLGLAIGTVAIAVIAPASSDAFLLGSWTAMDARLVADGRARLDAGIGGSWRGQGVSVRRPRRGRNGCLRLSGFAALWGMLFFSEAMDALTVAGRTVIVVAGVVVLKPIGPQPAASPVHT